MLPSSQPPSISASGTPGGIRLTTKVHEPKITKRKDVPVLGETLVFFCFSVLYFRRLIMLNGGYNNNNRIEELPKIAVG